MNKHFKSIKSPGFGALLIIVSGLLLVLLFGLPIISKNPIALNELILKCVITILVIGFFIWCWTSTFYTIDKENLIVKSGPLSLGDFNSGCQNNSY